MFSRKEKVRYSEVDSEGFIKMDAIVNYFQDCSMYHSQAVGRGIDVLKKDGNFWLLSSWQIQVIKRPVLYQDIVIKTNPYSFQKFFGNRYFEIADENGECLVRANSIWIFINENDHRPRRIPPEESGAYTMEPQDELEWASRKVEMPQNLVAMPALPVMPCQIDTNHHVNNCEYVKTAMNVLNDTTVPSQLRVEYKAAAVKGDVFYPYVLREGNMAYVDLRNEAGTTFASCEFKY